MEWKKEKLRSVLRMNREKLIFLFCSGLLLFVISIPTSGGSPGTGSPGGVAESRADGSGSGAFYGEETGRNSVWGSGAEGQAASWSGTADQSASWSSAAREMRQESNASGQTAARSGVAGQTAGAGETGTSGAGQSLEAANSGAAVSGKESYEEELEGRIRTILSGVDGVGEVDVMVVLKSSAEQVLHVDQNSSSVVTEEGKGGEMPRSSRQQTSESTTVLAGQAQAPVVEKELMPELSGIVISADGGGSALVRAEISEAMEALFGLPAHKIKVLKRVKKGV